MTGDVVIRAEGLGKKYLIGHLGDSERHPTLRDALTRTAGNLRRKMAGVARGRGLLTGNSIEEFWALKDISFEVRRGEVLGIIGRNGAGKSTLLKILSRITEPTEGRVTINGRVASLLEVGTGFHPELSGRENIYLNGAILGMTRGEIRKKFDEIVAFAEVEKFIDTPVKRYSSGMYVRLAFAVAAHLEPEILIVDEVLSVGDAEFQKKCLGKMDEVSRRQGRTVLIVSHNMTAIAELADRAVLLDRGSIAIEGSVPDAVSRYLSRNVAESIYISPHDEDYDLPHIARVEVSTAGPGNAHHFGEPLEAKFWIRHPRRMRQGCFSFQIINQYQSAVVHAWAFNPTVKFGHCAGESMLVCRFPSLRLNVGRYHLRCHLSEPPGGPRYEGLEGICGFEVVGLHGTTPFWGFRPENCVYHEEYHFNRVEPLSDISEWTSASVDQRTASRAERERYGK